MKKLPVKYTIIKWTIIICVGISGIFIMKNNLKSDDYKINLETIEENEESIDAKEKESMEEVLQDSENIGEMQEEEEDNGNIQTKNTTKKEGFSGNVSNNKNVKEDKDVVVNINTANFSTLCKLKGIGEVTARKIIDYRNTNGNFENIEDITKVSGIGPKKFEKIKDQIVVK